MLYILPRNLHNWLLDDIIAVFSPRYAVKTHCSILSLKCQHRKVVRLVTFFQFIGVICCLQYNDHRRKLHY